MTVSAEFRDAATAEAAVEAVAGMGIGKSSLELFSSKPVELRPGVLDRPSRMSLFAVLGGLANGGLATAFMFWTQLDYPIVTGGMPLNSGWATGVITFELTMAGAIAGTVLGFLWEGRFLRGEPRPLESSPRGDSILIQIRCSAGEANRTVEGLWEQGAVKVLRHGEES